MESHPITERIPDQSLLIENNLPASERIQATRGKDYIFIYSAAGKPFTVVMGKTEGKTINVSWFNPRNGVISKDPQIPNTGNIMFRPPSSGYGQDWVLILDEATKNYTIH